MRTAASTSWRLVCAMRRSAAACAAGMVRQGCLAHARRGLSVRSGDGTTDASPDAPPASPFYNTTARRAATLDTPSADRPYDPNAKVAEAFPIVQLPARTLWSPQYILNGDMVATGDFAEMIQRVKDARHYYQYPSLSAPQIGWNVQMFTLFDDTVFINPVNLDEEEWRRKVTEELARESACGGPFGAGSSSPAAVHSRARAPVDLFEHEQRHMAALRQEGRTAFAWEPCASCCFLMHYIERPSTLRLRAVNEKGETHTVELTGMRARFALHELDHINGILFTRRVVDTDHVVPLEGFNGMSDWSDDYPSLEARSTFLYTSFTPPYHFAAESVVDANLLDRKFEDGVYPGCERDRQMRIQSAAWETIQRDRWRRLREEAAEGQGTAKQPAEATAAQEDNADVGDRSAVSEEAGADDSVRVQ